MEATKCGGGWGLAIKSYIKGERERESPSKHELGS